MDQPESKTIAKLLAGKLIERRDVLALQYKDSKGVDMYSPHRTMPTDGRLVTQRDNRDNIPVSLGNLVEHVEGRKTFGHYLVTDENTVRMFAFDIDLINTPSRFGVLQDEPLVIEDPRALWAAGGKDPMTKHLGIQMREMSERLAMRVKELLEIPVTVHYSGNKGVHVSGLLDPGTPATDAREMMNLVLESMGPEWELYKGKNFWRCSQYDALHIETFPKQNEVRREDGLGNLLRLPLGMNVKSGKKSFFVDMNQPVTSWKQDDPILALTEGSLR